VVLGLALLGVSSLVFGVAQDIVLLDAARFFQGVGGACSWTGGLAWLVADAPPDRRGALIGTALGAAIGGSLFGPVLGAVAEATSRGIVFGSVLLVAAGLAAWALATPSVHEPDRQDASVVAAALRSAPVVAGMWLVTIPALAFGAVNVVGSLRLDELGAGTALIGATFLAMAALEAIVSPIVGRVSDRRGRLVPVRAGLAAATAALLLVPLPGDVAPLIAGLILLAGCLGAFWAPAMALLADAAERAGVAQGYAFALVNAAWAGGAMAGSAGSGALADATADAVPFVVLAALTAGTLAVLLRVRRRAPVAA
jgi:MFS family permease